MTTRKYRPALLEKRRIDGVAALKVLDILEAVVQPLEAALCNSFPREALERISVRDADGWPVLACALAIGSPVWTEDADFFGAGIATWTTDRVEIYLVS